MVVPLGPGKFYGSSLPRPRLYDDVKFNAERIDPPVSVLDPLLSWANEAHWSMGGLSFKRLRLQGRIEGNVNKLRAELEKKQKNKTPIKLPKDDPKLGKRSEIGKKRSSSASPPPAPIAAKRRRYMALVDESEEEEEVRVEKKKPARKLYDEFDKVAKESEKSEKSEKAAGSKKGSGKDSQRMRQVVEDVDDGGLGDLIMSVVEEVNREDDAEVMKVNKKSKKKTGEVKSKNETRVSSRPKKGAEKENVSNGANSTRVSPRLAKRG